MSLDRPTGGDGDPDRFSRREDRPFPGAPADREPAPELPRNTLSMDELRAVYDRSHSLAELQAEARAYEEAQARADGSSDSPGPASPDSASPGEGPAEADGDAFPLGTRPAVRDAHADGELQAMAPEYTAVHQEASAAGAGREQVLDGQYGFFGRPGDLQDQRVNEPGDRVGDEHATPGTWPSLDTLPQPERAGETGREKDSEAQVEDGQGRKPKDLVQLQHLVPDDETDRPAETASEAAPDRQLDDPRMAAMERQMERMMATVEAMQRKFDASEARHEEDKAALEQKLGDLQAENSELKQKVAEMEAARHGGQEDSGRLPENPDEWSPREREITESLVPSDTSSTADDSDAVDFSEAASVGADKEARKVPEIAERPGFSEETRNALSAAAGLGGTIGFLNPVVGLAVGADAARRAYEKMTPDEQRDAMRMTDSAMTALGSMPPGAAVAAVTLSMMAPTLQDGFKNMYHKLKRKD